MRKSLFALALSVAAFGAQSVAAAPVQYDLDAGHSQIVFSYNHLGFSTTYGMFSGFSGKIVFDADAPDTSSVNVSMPVKSMFTGWEQRLGHIMSPDFFGASDDELVSFSSTSIEVTGDNTAKITGDLEINGVTKSVVLDATLNQSGKHPRAGKEWLGLDATTTILRSDFGVGAFAPYVGDEVSIRISIEAGQAD